MFYFKEYLDHPEVNPNAVDLIKKDKSLDLRLKASSTQDQDLNVSLHYLVKE